MPYVVYGSATLSGVTCDDKGMYRIGYNKMGGEDKKMMKGRFAVIVKGCRDEGDDMDDDDKDWDRDNNKDDDDDKSWDKDDDDKDWDNSKDDDKDMDDDKSDKKMMKGRFAVIVKGCRDEGDDMDDDDKDWDN